MRFKAAILAVGLVVMCASGASANGTFCIGPTAGMSLPTGNYGDAANTGWHAGATCDYNMPSGFCIGSDFMYHSWGGSDAMNAAAAAAFGTGSEISWSAFQFTPHAAYRFQTRTSVKPYCQAGVGLYSLKSKLTSPSGNGDTSKSKMGFNFGGGMDFTTKGTTTWGIDTAYHVISAQNDLGTDVNNFTVGLHMKFGMGSH